MFRIENIHASYFKPKILKRNLLLAEAILKAFVSVFEFETEGAIFWKVAPYSLVVVHRHFRTSHCLHLQSCFCLFLDGSLHGLLFYTDDEGS
jgi:hypothetical protein